jgi:hypothetical protein
MRFYVLEPERGERFGTKWAYGDTVGTGVFEKIGQRCPVCGETVGHLVWLPPHRIRLSSSKPFKWGDFLWGVWLSGPMVSAHFRTVYEQGQMKGIRQFHPPAEIVSAGRRRTGDVHIELPTYHLIEIERLGPELDEDASGVVRVYLKCSYCHRGRLEGWDRIVIKPGTWSGEDIFFPRGLPGTCVVSEQLKDAVDINRLTNVRLIPVEECSYSEHRGSLQAPGA